MDFHGNLIDPPGWQGAFRRDPDGLGYTLEYRIPWSLLCLGPEAPRAGDVTATSWTVHWSDRDGKLSRGHLVDLTNPAESGFESTCMASCGASVAAKPSFTRRKAPRPIGQPPVPADTESRGTTVLDH